MISCIKKHGDGAVLLDGYKFDPEYLNRLRNSQISPIVAMMDEVKGDVFLELIDLGVFPTLRNLCLDYPNVLLGPDYALIRDEFKVGKDRADFFQKKVKSDRRKRLPYLHGGC